MPKSAVVYLMCACFSYIHLLNTFKVVTPADHPDHRLLDLSISRLERMKMVMEEVSVLSLGSGMQNPNPVPGGSGGFWMQQENMFPSV